MKELDEFKRIQTGIIIFKGTTSNGRAIALENIDGTLMITDQEGDRKMLINPNIPADMRDVPAEESLVVLDLYNYVIENGLYNEGSEFLYFAGATLYKCSVLFGVIHTMAFTAVAPVTVVVQYSTYETQQAIDGETEVLTFSIDITPISDNLNLVPYPAKFESGYNQTDAPMFETVYMHLAPGINNIELPLLPDQFNRPVIEDLVSISYMGLSLESYYIKTNPLYDEFMVYDVTNQGQCGLKVAVCIGPMYNGQFSVGDYVQVRYDDDTTETVELINAGVSIDWGPLGGNGINGLDIDFSGLTKTIVTVQKVEPSS